MNQANRETVAGLAPERWFSFFAEIAAIPRCSGETGALADYLAAFARRRGLACERDAVGNVVIRKGAQGTDSRTGVILQVHQDMVCVKDPDSDHVFATDPIRLVRDGEWIRADGTTLGADDGVGIATILAVLDDPRLVHPPLEALFTVDEETTMAGAKAVRADQLRGEVLINIDSEEYGTAYVSSAASATYTLAIPMRRTAAAPAGCFRLAVGGLRGGHSGTEINQGLANAFVLLARILSDASERGLAVDICGIDSGNVPAADNAIPTRAEAALALDAAAWDAWERLAKEWQAVFRNEFRVADPEATVTLEQVSGTNLPPLQAESRDRLLAAIRLMPLGALRFQQDPGLAGKPYGQVLVETSNNLGVLELEADEALLYPLARSSVATSLDDVDLRLKVLARLVGGALRPDVRNAGWETAAPPDRVQRLFQRRGWRLVGIHAGLECGALIETMQRAGRSLEAISIGPDVMGGHTPRECFRIASIQPFWGDLAAVLAEL